MKRTSVLVVSTLCLALTGCEEKKHVAPTPEVTGAAPGKPTPGAPATATPTTTTTPVTPTVSDQDIPVEADFEEEAERDIVPGNMDAELTKIEKELAAEMPTEGGAVPPAGTTTTHPGGTTTAHPGGTTHRPTAPR